MKRSLRILVTVTLVMAFLVEMFPTDLLSPLIAYA